MVLHGAYLESCLAEDFIGTADFPDVVVGNTHLAHLAAMKQRDKSRSPALHVHRIVNPVHVDVIQPHAFQGGFGHLNHVVVIHLGHLRRELGGNLHVFPFIGRCQMPKDPLRFSHAVGRCRVPEVEPRAHGGVKDGFKVVFIGGAAKDGVSAEHSCAPGPGSKCYFCLFHKVLVFFDTKVGDFSRNGLNRFTDLPINFTESASFFVT